jgi:CHAT domain-containing protein
VLRALASAPLAHFAVHGFDSPAGGFLQLAGDDGRLSARDLATIRLPRSRVVLAACDAAGPAANGLPWAFARAGAVAVVAAQERADDAAAAAWAQRFYAALAQGNGFARANREALLAVPEARFVVTK